MSLQCNSWCLIDHVSRICNCRHFCWSINAISSGFTRIQAYIHRKDHQNQLISCMISSRIYSLRHVVAKCQLIKPGLFFFVQGVHEKFIERRIVHHWRKCWGFEFPPPMESRVVIAHHFDIKTNTSFLFSFRHFNERLEDSTSKLLLLQTINQNSTWKAEELTQMLNLRHGLCLCHLLALSLLSL